VVNINIVQTPWAEVFQGVLSANRLTYAWEGDIIRVMTADDMKFDLELDQLRTQQKTEILAQNRAEPLVTSIVKIKFADAAALKESLAPFLAKDAEGKPLGSIEVDVHTNSLIVNSIRSDIDRLVRMITRLDAPRAQIKLKAHIVETTQDTARALGIQRLQSLHLPRRQHRLHHQRFHDRGAGGNLQSHPGNLFQRQGRRHQPDAERIRLGGRRPFPGARLRHRGRKPARDAAQGPGTGQQAAHHLLAVHHHHGQPEGLHGIRRARALRHHRDERRGGHHHGQV
jgi:type II secretory pathway component GspD/PulD (secretin)